MPQRKQQRELVVIGCAVGRLGLYRCYCYGADSIEQAVKIAKALGLMAPFIEDCNRPARRLKA